MDDQTQNQARQQQVPVVKPVSGSMAKETVSTSQYHPEFQPKPVEYLSESEKSPDLNPEVKEAGVEVIQEPQIPTRVKQAGVRLSQESTPVDTEMRIKEIMEMEKAVHSGGSGNSGSWLWKLLDKALKRLRIKQ